MLGRKVFIGLIIIAYLDNDNLNTLKTKDTAAYALELRQYISKEQLLKQHPRVFEENVGMLKGQYHIQLEDHAVPVQHSPRRVPAALREQLKATLDDLVKQQIFALVTKPTPRINSMVVVPKKNGTLRICLNPKDLNRYIQRENYQLPTIEDIVTRLDKVLDVRSRFWHVQLDAPFSLLTTFHTPLWAALMA